MLTGELGSLRGALRIWVYLGQGKMPKYEPEFLSEVLLHALDDGISKSAIPALIIAVFDKRDRGVFIALDMII
jgi:hypothetical protein